MSEVPEPARETWRALGQRVSARSRHLGAAFLANTEPVLAADGGIESLRAWVDAALALLEREAWQAQVIVELCFANAPGTVLATRAPAAWLEVALALSAAIDPQHFLSEVPACSAAAGSGRTAGLPAADSSVCCAGRASCAASLS